MGTAASEELRGGAGGETHGPNNQTTSDVREREGYQHDGNTLAAGRPNRVPTKPRMRDDEANDRIHGPKRRGERVKASNTHSSAREGSGNQWLRTLAPAVYDVGGPYTVRCAPRPKPCLYPAPPTLQWGHLHASASGALA